MSRIPQDTQRVAGSPQLVERQEHPRAGQPQLLTQLHICRRLGIGVTTWRRWRAARRVPAPVPGLPGRPRWRLADIEAFERGLHGTGRRYFGSARLAG